MLQLTGEFIAESTGGDLLLGHGMGADEGVSIDTRSLVAGEAFLAIRGDHVDGHEYLETAVQKGAAGLVVNRDRADHAVAVAATAPDQVFVVAVDDTVKALVAMATAWVEVMSPAVIAVTGSMGKSTTKDMMAAVCAVRFVAHATPGNLNNRLGLSLTCLKLLPRHEVLVAEMGTSGPGEIAELCRIAPPRMGIVTAVEAAHIEGFGSLDAVTRAKSELVRAVPSDGCVVLNADDPRVMSMAEGIEARVWTFGKGEGTDVRILEAGIGENGRTRATFNVGGQVVETRLSLFGAHQASNAAAALAMGTALEIDAETCCHALASVAPGRHRMHLVVAGPIRVIDDCYNAAPRTVSAALTVLADMDVGRGRRVAVLGDMLELGVLNDQAHEVAGREVVERKIDLLIAVGANAGRVARAAMEAGLPHAAVFEAPDSLAAAGVAAAIVEEGDLVLVKGSRGVALERVVNRLVREFDPGPKEGN